LVPPVAGSRGVGSEGLAAENGFLTKWKQQAPPMSPFTDAIRVVPGVRRAIVTETQQYAGRSSHPHAELHYDGAGFGATPRIYYPPDDQARRQMLDGDPKAYKILQDAMEIQILDLVLFLAHHTVDTGASGECLLRAQQLILEQTGPIREITPAQMFEPISFVMRAERTDYHHVDLSLTMSVQPQPMDTSVFLDELVSDLRAVVRTSYGLASDILGEFGVSEPIILRPDGELNTHRLLWERKQQIEPWAQQRGLVAPPAV
jgi:hypothetical protein